MLMDILALARLGKKKKSGEGDEIPRVHKEREILLAQCTF